MTALIDQILDIAQAMAPISLQEIETLALMDPPPKLQPSGAL